MNSRTYSSSLVKRIVLGLCAVVFALSVVSQTQAKSPETSPTKALKAVYVNHPQALRIINDAGLKAHLFRLFARTLRTNPKSVKVISKNCGCALAAQDELASFGSCMKGCLADLGIGAYALIMCGASCAVAETPPGIILCAICVGLSVTAVETCAIGCLLYPKDGKGPAGILGHNFSRRHPDRRLKQARLTVKTVGAHS